MKTRSGQKVRERMEEGVELMFEWFLWMKGKGGLLQEFERWKKGYQISCFYALLLFAFSFQTIGGVLAIYILRHHCLVGTSSSTSLITSQSRSTWAIQFEIANLHAGAPLQAVPET